MSELEHIACVETVLGTVWALGCSDCGWRVPMPVKRVGGVYGGLDWNYAGACCHCGAMLLAFRPMEEFQLRIRSNQFMVNLS